MKVTADEKVKLSFDITANPNTIEFFVDIQPFKTRKNKVLDFWLAHYRP